MYNRRHSSKTGNYSSRQDGTFLVREGEKRQEGRKGCAPGCVVGGGKRQILGSDLTSGLSSAIYNCRALAHFPTSLCLSFLSLKMGIIMD